MNRSARFYLARNQKIMGPVSFDEVQALRQSGRILTFSWICEEGDTQWTPIDPAPPLPTLSKHAPVERETYRVVLFDRCNAISGWLVQSADGGCEIQSDQNGPDPLFCQQSIAHLTLQDSRTGDSIKIAVRIAGITRTAPVEGKRAAWRYKLRWKVAPELLSRSQAPMSA